MSDVTAQFGAQLTRRARGIHSVLLLIGSLASGLGASYPQNTWLQVGPVVAFALMFPWLSKWPLSGKSTALITAFLLLHLLAARWTYSDVPYERWLLDFGGFDIERLLGTGRNMFDRLVHFAFGLCAVRPIMEWEMRVAGVTRRLAYRLAILLVLAVSASYEIFEWTLAIIVSPEAADKYNGQQGDMFDAQKDMWLALFGAGVALLVVHLRRGGWARR